MKRYLTLLLALGCTISTNALTYEYNGITYDLDPETETATVTYASPSYNSYSGAVEIPQLVLDSKNTNYVVAAVGSNAFRNCTGLTSISLPVTVESIDSYAFYGCTSLTSLTLPKLLSSIGTHAFDGCAGITSVTMPTMGELEVISDYAFANCSSLEAITLPSGITTIGEYAFLKDSKLASISLATSLTSVGAHAFEECSALTDITLPAATSVVGAYAFAKCEKLNKLTLTDGLESIGSHAFSSCSSLSDVTLPNTVISLGDYAFSGASGLAAIRLSNGLTKIEDYTFQNCTSLTTLTLPAGVTTVGEHALSSCSKLTTLTFAEGMSIIPRTYATTAATVNLPSTTLQISDKAFEGFADMDKITLPDGLAIIGSLAFNCCSALASINLPASVNSFAADALRDCGNLSSITVAAGNATYDSRNACNAVIETATNTLLAGCQKSFIPTDVTAIGAEAFRNCTGLTAITIPQSVAAIGNNAFLGCNNLIELTYGEGVTTALRTYATNMKQVSLPASCTAIAERAFFECRSIQNITLPEHLASIGKEAFACCSALGRIVLPASLTAMGVDAFRDCDNLINLEYAEGTRTALRTYANKMASVTIPPSCISFADDVFKGCSQLASIYIKDLESWNCIFYDQANNPFCCDHFIYLNGVVINDLITNFGGDIAQHAFSHVKGLKSVTLTGQITGIGREAFAGCTELESVVVGNKASRVADKAFAGCTSLQTVRLGSGNQQIGKEAFYGCTALNSVHLGGNEESIGNDAFHNCNSLPEIRIPASVKTIGQGAFENCYALSLANIPEGVQSIKPYTFSECRVLEQITIPASVTSIGTSAFSGCASLSKIEIPEAVQSLGDYTFYGCSQLHHIYIGAGVKSIGAKAFADCSYLKDLFVYPTEVPATDITAFDGSITESIKPFVPAESVEAYAATSPWNQLMSVGDLAEAPVYVTRIEIEPEVMIISLDDLETISATVFPANASNQNLVWNSSDNGIATVSGSKTKRVFPMSEGVATITAYAQDNNGARAQSIVIVTDNYVPVTSLSLDKTELTLTEGDEYHFTATTTPASATYAAVKWSSSDEDVLTVSSDGLITAIKAGAATITATTADGTALVASCHVTIKRPTYSSLAGLGDVDDDGFIDQDDIQAVTDLILGKRGGVDDSFDVNHDGQFTIADAVTVINNMKEYGTTEKPELQFLKIETRYEEARFGATGTIEAQKIPFNAYADLVWSVSDESILAIETNGTICTYTVIGAGDVIISVKDKSNEAINTNMVIKAISPNPTLSQTSLSLKETETATLSFDFLIDEGLDQSVTWKSSNPEIASVDENGKVIAIQEGVTVISVHSNQYPLIQATCELTVLPLHEYVDLGLTNDEGKPIYWATCNIGADNPEDYGQYFAWGATEGYYKNESYYFDWSTAPFNNGSSDFDKDYWNTVKDIVYPNETLALEYDAVRQNWGGTWRMPTKSDLQQLIEKCTWTPETKNGVAGYTVKGINGNSIFLPTAGYLNFHGHVQSYSISIYLSSTLLPHNHAWVYIIHVDSYRQYVSNDERYMGFSIRPVKE